jgi:hypothetical protein
MNRNHGNFRKHKGRKAVLFLDNMYRYLRYYRYMYSTEVLRFCVADPDPGSAAFLAPGSGMGKKSRFGVRENILDYISESFVTIFWVKNTSIPSQLSDPNPGWKNPDTGSGMEKSTSDIRDKHSGSATLHAHFQFSILKKDPDAQALDLGSKKMTRSPHGFCTVLTP